MDFNKNEYYTPDISEFYIGFEYEWRCLSTNTDWIKSICDEQMNPLDIDCRRINEYRVKYLNQSDIESLGFIKERFSMKYIMYGNEFLCMEKKHINLIIYIELLRYNNKTKTSILIHNKETMKDNESALLFTGYIKNKSELISLLNKTVYTDVK